MRWLKVSAGILGMLIIGYVREQYILNFLNKDLPFLIRRSRPDLSSYPVEVEHAASSLAADPRWFTTIVLLLIMEGLTAFTLYSYFQKKYVLKISLLYYTVLISVAGICVATSFLFKSYGIGYETAQNIKNVLQLPFILLILFPVFYFIEHTRK